ncbi:calcium activated potassium channel subunit isoform 1 [Schistosoma japonicum]|uniref:Calcium activated potassium channel subunit isoform 1 n=1 Tax=Schistosoma japonicum TaxID=6182 RepID=A0A4Z2DBM8_SCHJA|nr:calcium activated potassium channel subunit isoform 1 [Schistosoma japonicum]
MNASIKRERLKPSSSSLRTITSTSNYNFATRIKSHCSTSPCHRREEDNKVAVEEFKRDLSRRNVFRCYAPPLTTHSLYTVSTNQQSSSYIPSSSQSFTLSNSSTVSTSKSSPINRHLPLHSQTDLKDAAAILHRLYTPSMFMHGLLWPGGIFLIALIILLFTYFTDSCEAWAGDKTVIA